MLRSQYKNTKYFDEYISLNMYFIKDFEDEIVKSSGDTEKIERLKSANFTYAYKTLIAMYSRGDSMDAIAEFFLVVVDKFRERHDDGTTPMDTYSFDSYVEYLWMLSWCILLAPAKDVVDTVCTAILRTGRHDFFIDLFLHQLGRQQPIADALYYPNSYGTLKTAVSGAKEALPQKLKAYLDQDYYKGMQQAYWYEDQLKEHDIYFGHWCFEVAALVKIFAVDDALLRESEYYPGGMVMGR